MTPTGAEHAQQYSTFCDSPASAVKIKALASDADFAIVLAAWPELPADIRAAIVRLVEAASPGLTPNQCGLPDSGGNARREKRA